MNLQWLKFIVWSLLNPICIISSFCTTNYLGMYHSVGSNAVAFSFEFFPVYLFIGMLTLLAQLVFLCILAPGIKLADVCEAFLLSQQPFIIMFIVASGLLVGVEGNVMGFIVVPLFIVLSGVSGVISIGRYLNEITRIKERKEASAGSIKEIGYAVVLTLIMALFSICQYGMYTHLVNYMEWRTDIPQYAVTQAMRAIKDRNPDAFMEYVDLDSVLELAQNVEGAPTKAEILKAIEQGQLLTSDGERLKVGEWVMAKQNAKRNVGTFEQEPMVESCTFSNKDNLVKAEAIFYSIANGKKIRVVFELQKADGKYKITGGADFRELVEEIKKYHEDLEAFPGAANTNATQSIVVVNLLGVAAELPQAGSLEESDWIERSRGSTSESYYLPVKISAEVSNHLDKKWIKMILSVVFRDVQTNRVLAVSNARADADKEPMQPQEKRQFVFHGSARPYLLLALKEGKAKVAEVYPARVQYEDKQYLEIINVELPEIVSMDVRKNHRTPK